MTHRPRVARTLAFLLVAGAGLAAAHTPAQAHFKLIAATNDGSEVRQVSERATLDVTGSIVGLGKALLAPQAGWSIE